MISRLLFGMFILLVLSSCASTVPRQDTVNKDFPAITGTALNGQKWSIPKDMEGKNTLLIIGYKQSTQFDIDRWLIGIDQVGYQATIFEIPTVQGWFPKLISTRIDDGMRSGIPEELWKIVVTVYDDAEKVINFTGNEDGLNARVIVLDERGRVKFMHDRGFSVDALNKLAEFFPIKKTSNCAN